MTTAPDNATDCILCNGKTTLSLAPLTDNRFGAPGEYSIVRCTVCGLLQTEPRPDAETLRKLYEHYYNFGGRERKDYASFRETLYRSRLYRLWLRFDGDITFTLRKGRGRLLDIGCNEGRGLQSFQANGYTPTGLEINRVAAAAARARGFTVTEKAIEEFEPDAPFDIAVLTNVLEHSLDPRGMLGHIHRILRPRGELWITLPNADSAFRYIFGTSWINWHVPYHITHFTARTLDRLLKETGFETIVSKNITPALWIAQSFLVKVYARAGNSTLELRGRWILGLCMLLARVVLFPFLWAANISRHGDCLVVIARKT